MAEQLEGFDWIMADIAASFRKAHPDSPFQPLVDSLSIAPTTAELKGTLSEAIAIANASTCAIPESSIAFHRAALKRAGKLTIEGGLDG